MLLDYYHLYAWLQVKVLELLIDYIFLFNNALFIGHNKLLVLLQGYHVHFYYCNLKVRL